MVTVRISGVVNVRDSEIRRLCEAVPKTIASTKGGQVHEEDIVIILSSDKVQGHAVVVEVLGFLRHNISPDIFQKRLLSNLHAVLKSVLGALRVVVMITALEEAQVFDPDSSADAVSLLK